MIVSQHPKVGRGRQIKLLLAFAVPFLLIVSLGLAWAMRSDSGSQGTQLPERLGGLALLQTKAGPAAMSDIAGMHEGEFDLQEARVYLYEGNATVWVGVAKGEQEAEGLLQAMAAAIGQGGSPFAAPRRIVVNGTPVFATSDGQQHYFYRSGKLVVWVAAPVTGTDPFLQEVTTLLP